VPILHGVSTVWLTEPRDLAPELGRGLRVRARLLAAGGDVAAAAYRRGLDAFAGNAFEASRTEAVLAEPADTRG
jgi:hypothetical protein